VEEKEAAKQRYPIRMVQRGEQDFNSKEQAFEAASRILGIKTLNQTNRQTIAFFLFLKPKRDLLRTRGLGALSRRVLTPE